jgi:arylsulfatase A-like enzyme
LSSKINNGNPESMKVKLIAGISIVVLAVSCSGEVKPTDASKEPAASQVKSENDKKQDPNTMAGGGLDNKPENEAPLAVPLAYFGDLGLKRLSRPMELAPEKKRSVVLLVIDALSAQRLGVYGNKRPTSPEIDKLAQGGLLMNNHVSNSSWTRPSFTTIITGLTKAEHGVELSGKGIDMEVTTVAERFRAAGYRTAGFVGNPLTRHIWGFGQGFQTYVDTKELDKAFPPDAWLVDRAIKWLEKNEEDPFFLMIFLTAPHAPYRPPARHRQFLKEYPGGKVIEYPFREYEKPLPTDDHERMVAAYDDEISYSDAQVGRLVEFLKEKQRLKNTAFVITADHGEVFGDHDCYTHAYHMWEPNLRVPLIIYSPDFKSRGVYDDRPSTHVDIVPTLLALAGLKGDERLSGVPITRAVEAGRVLFSQYNAHGIQRQAIRKGRFKLVHHHKVEQRALGKLNELHQNLPHADPQKLKSLATEGERFELFDLEADPEEMKNLFDELQGSPETIELMTALRPHLGENPAAPARLSDETIKALQNAGYLAPSTPDKNAKKK